tara:strand:+ start:68 stop:757 length:690 start_codon:yes stop_codon:yes gene_type:complete
MKKALYDILVFSADPAISESLESILSVINIRPKTIRDYSEIKDKITKKTRALLIDEYIIHNGKKEHIKKLYKKYNFNIPILCLIENIPKANINNSFINFFQKPINKNTLNNALMPYLSDASYSNINSIIKLGRFNFDSNLKTLSDDKKNLIYLTNLEARLLLTLFENLNNTLNEDFLLKKVWGYSSHASSNTIKTHIWRLRKKLYNNDDNVFNLETTANGYVLKQKACI